MKKIYLCVFCFLEIFFCVDLFATESDVRNKDILIDKNRISVQLFSVRKYGESKESVDYMLSRISKIGYPSVELAGFWGLSGKEWRELLDKYKLTVSAVHTNDFELSSEQKVQAVVDNLKQIGSSRLVFAFSLTDFEDDASRNRLVDKLINMKNRFERDGVELFYHNHHFEFVKTEQGEDAYLKLLGKIGMRAELDVYWVARAGKDPVSLIDKLGDKLVFLHLKDIGVGRPLRPGDPFSRSFVFKELGSGNLELGKIVSSASKNGCSWYVVEQDDDWANDEPLDSLKMSFDYLIENYAKN